MLALQRRSSDHLSGSTVAEYRQRRRGRWECRQGSRVGDSPRSFAPNVSTSPSTKQLHKQHRATLLLTERTVRSLRGICLLHASRAAVHINLISVLQRANIARDCHHDGHASHTCMLYTMVITLRSWPTRGDTVYAQHAAWEIRGPVMRDMPTFRVTNSDVASECGLA